MSMILDESQVIAWNLSGESMTLGEYVAPLNAELAVLRAVAVAWLDAAVWFDDNGNIVMTMDEWRKIGKPANDAINAGYLPDAQAEGLSS